MSFKETIRRVVTDTSTGNDWARFNCPVCHLNGEDKRDSKKSLSFNPRTTYYQCWRCGVKGSLEQDGKRPFIPAAQREFYLPDEFMGLFNGVGAAAQIFNKHRAYLKVRGLSEDVCTSVNVGACATGYWAGRVIVPCYLGVRLLGWVARALHPLVRPKYLYPKGMARRTMVFNQDALYEDTDAPLFIVEGVFDALALYPNAVALLGKPSNDHLSLFLKSTRHLVVAFDGDAHEECWAFATKLKMFGLNTSWVKLPAAEDPSSVGNNWIKTNIIPL